METGIIIAIISGLLLILLGIGVALYFLITGDNSGDDEGPGGDGGDGGSGEKPKPPIKLISKPSPPQNITYTYLI